jgi:hypothetical protein
MSYHNKNSQNVQINNVSYFNRCLFQTNDVSNFNGTTVTTAISMWDVIGIRVYGCTMDYLVPVANVEQRGNGIVAAKSTFRIQDYINTRSVFQNLNRAINASGPLKFFYPRIDHAQFINNRGGVLLTGFGLSRITRNDFNWVEITSPDDVQTYGVYLQECQGYLVTENHFDAANGVETYGVAVNNSGNAVTDIYKNYFTNLHAASMVYQDNRQEAGDVDPGLQWLCNEYGTSDGNNSNTYQIGVWGEVVPGIPSSQGFYQGTNPSTSAGNKFWEDCVPDPNDPSEYPNERELKLLQQINGSYYDYVHDAPYQSKPECATPGIGLIYSFENSSNDCGSHLFSLTGMGQTSGGLLSAIQANHSIEMQLKTAYDNYANNGTGPALEMLIKDPTKTSIEVRNALMDAAPKVTDDNLLYALKRIPALEGWHMAQAMLANSPLRASVLAELAKTDYYPYYKALVNAGQTGGLTTRQLMEMDYAHYITLQQQDLDELIRQQMDVEEDQENWSALAQNLSSIPYMISPKDQALFYGAQGDYNAARMELANCAADDDDYCAIISMALDIEESGMDSKGLMPSTQAALQQIAARNDHKMNATATQLLAFWGEATFAEFLSLPEGGNLKAMRLPVLEEVEVKNLAVNPNPSSGAMFINYLLPEGWEKAELRVYDVMGKLIATYNAAQYYGIIEMSAAKMAEGIYTIELVVDNIKTGSTKFSVIH